MIILPIHAILKYREIKEEGQCCMGTKYLYKITNTINDKVYVGVTINPSARWRNHKRKNSHCKALKAAIDKYGEDKFDFEILYFGSNGFVDELEVAAIQHYNSQAPNGYNITLGGEGTLYYEWKEEWNSLLGTMTDRALSKVLNIPHMTIGSRRKALGIPVYKRFEWKDYEHLLGVIPDQEVADMLSISTSCVQQQRLKRGYKKKERVVYNPTKEDEVLLNNLTLSQKQVSGLTGMGEGFINGWRKRKGIRHMGDGRGVEIEITEDLLAKLMDTKLHYSEICKQYGMASGWVFDKRKKLKVVYVGFEWDEDNLKLLHEDIPVQDLAKKWGISENRIYAKKKELNIPRRSVEKYPFLREEPYLSKIRDYSYQAKELAEEWGVGVQSVLYIRRKYPEDRPRNLSDLTKEEWQYVRFLYESGISYRSIGFNIGIILKRYDSFWLGLSGKSYNKATGWSLNEVRKR